jgi:hypothetical protein
MGREVRRVPATWKHPVNDTGRFKPLYSGEDYETYSKDFIKLANEQGLQAAIDEYGQAPDKSNYMPVWPAEECTHLMMYENTTEGTPISPSFPTPEQLARWLVANNASAFGLETGNYEGWLCVAKGGYAPSMVISGGIAQSGVDFLAQKGTP